VRAVQNQRTETEQRQANIEKEFDQLCETIQSELESLKATTLQSLSKKADYSMVETMREQMVKKVDHDYMQTIANKVKSESQALLATYQTE
jgi:cell division septum initiation protein DivIVA